MHTLFNKRIRGIHLYFKYNTIVYRIYCKDGFIIELLESRDKILLEELKAKHRDKNYFLVVGGRKLPYGISKEFGGDSKENVKWMDKCVASIMEKQPSMPKQRAIRICKSQFVKKSKAELEDKE